MTVAQGLEQLEAARSGAMEAGRFSDAIAALKTAGLWVEERRTHQRVDVAKLSDKDMARIAAAEQDAAGRLQ
jgi:hypothetical protein